tara:strand:- start:240 stop:947 length:708 start_codon:yes stop_codon:yes gene_type:complete
MADSIFTPYNPDENTQAPTMGPDNVAVNDAQIRVESTPGLPDSKKQMFGEKQQLAAGFSVTMENAADIINKIEDKKGGFLGSTGPTGWWDNQIDKSFDSDIWERALMSNDYKLYDQERRRWIMAQLRWESGAAIPPEEIESGLLAYFPQPFDPEEAITAKREARRLAMESMKTFGGEAYKKTKEDAYYQRPNEAAVNDIKLRIKQLETQGNVQQAQDLEAKAVGANLLGENWRTQ